MRRARRHRAAAALALVAALFAVPGAPATTSPNRPAREPDALLGRALVKFSPRADHARAHRRAGARPLRTLSVPGWDLVSVPASTTLARLLALYRAMPGVVAAEPVYRVRAALEPDDPCLAGMCSGTDQWNMYAVAAPLGWDLAGPPVTAAQRLSANPVTVAVLDTHIDFSHPDFANRGGATTDAADGGQLDWARARSWIAPNQRAGASAYHGTFVAGILGAAAGNARDVAGMAYGALILPLAVLDGSGRTDTASLAEAIAYASAQGARVLNMSLGTDGDAQVVHDAIIAAKNAGALVVAAAGNNTRESPFYPGSYPEVLSVSGTTAAGAPAPCSNYNDNVAVAAPAASVLSLAPLPERIRVISCGTSAAAPHVSGLAAMLFAQDPSRTAAQVRSIIERTADDDATRPGWDKYLGHGRLNVDRAMHDGIGPVITHVAATIPPRGGGVSTVTAIARSTRSVTAAEMYLDRPGHAPARVTLSPSDGAWGDTTEHLVAELPVTPEQTETTHELYVRAFDGSWGGGARGILPIDRTAPEIVGVRADPAIRLSLKQPEVSFRLRDNASARFVYTVNITGPDGRQAWHSGRVRCNAGPQSVYWLPPADALPGRYGIVIWAWDEAGNPAYATAQQLVV